jgi:hypothetical protein
MADEKRFVVIATHLRPDEAGMMRGLLESAGIEATVRDDMLSAIHPFLQPVIGGAKLVVHATDEERARELVQSFGGFSGAPKGPPVEIPEEEWSRSDEARQPAPRANSRPPLLRRAVAAAPFVMLLMWIVIRFFFGS